MQVGDVAPEFELMNQNKTKVKLSDYRGKKKLLLLFYPMDFSPVCTAEHCSFGPADGSDHRRGRRRRRLRRQLRQPRFATRPTAINTKFRTTCSPTRAEKW